MVFYDFYHYHKSHFSWKFYWNFSSCSEDTKNLFVDISYFREISSIFYIAFLQRNYWAQLNITDVSIFFTSSIL